MAVKLIAFDLDGTLMRSDKTIAERTLNALKQAAEKGLLLVPTTGRNYVGLPQEIKALPGLRYIIEMNGAKIRDLQENQILRCEEIGKEDALEIFSYMEQLPVPAAISCYQNDGGWMEREAWEQLEEFAPCPEQLPSMRRVHEPLENVKESVFQYGDTLQKQQFFLKREYAHLRAEYYHKFKEKFPEFSVTYSLLNNLEINAPEANKGSALKFLCEYLGIDRMESMAFGDGTNDMTMIRQAGIGVAMANAEEEVLAVADRVTLSNDADGVAVVLEELLKEL